MLPRACHAAVSTYLIGIKPDGLAINYSIALAASLT